MKKFKKRKDIQINWLAYQVFKMLSEPALFLKIVKGIKNRIYKVIGSLDVEVIRSKEPIPFAEIGNYQAEPLKVGDKWGGFFDCAWFNLKGQVPEEGRGKHIALIFDIQGEGCLMDAEGTPVKGLTRILSVSDALNTVPGKKTLEITKCSEGNEKIDLWIEGGNNGFFMKDVGDSKLKRVDIVTVNDGLTDLYFDFITLFNVFVSLPKRSKRRIEIESSLIKACKVLKKFTDTNIRQASDILSVELAKEAEEDFTFYATGHAHLDLAWLWPIRETKRKAGRTFANQLDLIEKYPEYIFCASQPQMYKWIKEIYPKQYEKVKKAVKEGKIEPVGGMWVEPDCNVSSGESLVRQFLYGKRFFRQEFGKDMKISFLPDVFGFNGMLPQIMKKSGVEYFLTTKMSWNEYNDFPYHSFNWEGLDGSKVLAHMPPSGNYNADLTGYYINKSHAHYKEKETGIASMLFGAGDGGGGPSKVQVEMMRRQGDLQGIRKVKPSTQIAFFEKLDKLKDTLPSYKGELYLEKHTGTYTTQAKNKYFNRKIENRLHDIEGLASIAFVKKGYDYPHEKINAIWEEVLLYQFHDILPGSSIKRVYDESVERYQVMLGVLDEIEKEIIAIMSSGNKLSAFNSAPFARNEWVTKDGRWYLAQAAPYSSAVVKESEGGGVSYDGEGIYSERFSVKFSPDGSIYSLFDKELNKEFAAGEMNRLAVYHDKKLNFNAWDIHPKYINNLKGTFKLMGHNTFVNGPKVIRRNFLQYNKSTITQDIILTKGCPYVEFDTKVEWQENKKMLRANFYPSVFSDETTCNIQFGNIRRKTNTDDIRGYAQYEICAHKWVDVSEGGYGISLLNDCKYGHRVKDGLISLNLLRSTKYPDKTADRGSHQFRYALYPHTGSCENSEVTALGYTFNSPLELSKNIGVNGFVSVDNEDVIIETVKKAEDYEGIILRLYESKGKPASASLKIDLKGWKAKEVNLVEDIMGDIDISDLSFGPFEIKSILFIKEGKQYVPLS